MFFLADPGVCANELTDLKMSDIDLVKGSAVIRHGKLVASGGWSTWGRMLRRELRKYLAQRKHAGAEDALFARDDGDPLTFAGLRQIVRRRAAMAGLALAGLARLPALLCPEYAA